ncbi:hypothetical protein EYS09_12025 [Streptomyces kasugaensis]|uniref:Pilus assembly protein n=1 Tax=Streptomyces kasugaensis TaxID=1946 RepID=A0A4Q9HW61_STRKA|nr:hypothetical protein [Streptomyces kasugaensis]TBO59468.1 hypothetical protein EYS09_12025 [Streptomyces kasugaensis]
MAIQRRLRWRDDDRGTYTLETVICVTFLLPFLGLLAAYGLAGIFDSSVDNAASSAARAASQAADADTAQARGLAAATASLRQDDRNCTSRTVRIDTSAFNAPLGQAASVTATVTCTIPISQLTVPGLPGSKTLTATAISALDQYADRAE